MKKTHQKVGIKGTYLNIIKAIYDKHKANIILNGEKLKAFPLRSGIRQGCPLTTFIPQSCGNPSHSNRRRKRNKRNTNWKEVKLLLFADDMILYIENPILSIIQIIHSSFKCHSLTYKQS